jgi:hypothetical protein
VCAALPAAALAAGETLTVIPSNTQAGGNPDITATLHFAVGDTPKSVVTSLAPGLLANLNANPSCLSSPAQHSSACQIGTATTTTTAGALMGTMYLAPPDTTGDGASIDVVTPGQPTQTIGISLNPSQPGGLNLTTTFPQPAAGEQITDFSATLNSTLNGQPFTRLPSSCNPAISTASIAYYSGATGSASGGFPVTGCATLPYAPILSAAVSKDPKDSGAAIVLGITQAANEAASKSIVLNVPKGLSPNFQADVPCLNTTGCVVGTATARSPLVPDIALANGIVRLAGPATAPTLSVSFPPPFAFTLTGTISLTNSSVTFASVPDVPLTSLIVNVTGPGKQKAFTTDCAPATLSGTFTAQSGATHTPSATVAFNNCPVRPTLRGSTGGLATGHPSLKFTVARGKGAPKLSSVAIGLPGGLRFSRSAFVTNQTCTVKKGHKKCTTTTLIKGLGISGAKAKAVALRRGRLVITLKGSASKVTISVSGPLVSETKSLQSRVKKHRVKRLTFTLKVTDTKKATTTLLQKLRAH